MDILYESALIGGVFVRRPRRTIFSVHSTHVVGMVDSAAASRKYSSALVADASQSLQGDVFSAL
jgi:hypothetical protein